MTQAIRVQPDSVRLGLGVRGPVPSAPKLAIRAAEIAARLEAAGATLLAMPAKGYSTQLRQMKFDIVHTALEAYGWQSAAARPPMPSAAEISAMDEAFGWLALIPEPKFMIRRILGARALVHPLTGRHIYPWRRLAVMLGADHKSVQRWHGQGLVMLEAALAG
jgi:hypothetical protein